MRSHQMVTGVMTVLVLALALHTPIRGQNTAEELYQAALYQEEVQGNLQEAIGLFERILADFPSNRPVAANALMHIGLCHEKRGSQEAQQAYQRLLRDYADQISVADRARMRLASLQGLARVESPAEERSSGQIFVRHLRGGDFADFDATGAPSPDGRYLASIDWGETASNVAVVDLVTQEHRILTDHPAYNEGMALSAGFSPDGNTIAYWWFNGDESAEVRLAFRDGSPARTLCSDRGAFYWPGPWRGDGRSLIVGRQGPDGSVEIGWVSLGDGVFDALAAIPASTPRPGTMSLSPDETFLAFDFPVAADSDRQDISMIPSTGGPEVRIVRHPANDRVIGWVPGTNDFLFVSDRGGKSDLYAVEVENGEIWGDPWVVRRDVGAMSPMGFTRDGDLFYWIYTLRMFVNVAPFDPATGTVRAEATRPLLGAKASGDLSPDGRYLTYWHKKDLPTGAGDWNQVLGITDLDTGEERELAPHIEVERPKWSSDGRTILALGLERDRKETEAPAYFRIDPQTGEAQELIRFPSTLEWYWNLGAVEAPNGRDIVYVREGRLVLHEVASGTESELYRHSGLVYRLLEPSADGRSLLFAFMDSTSGGFERGTLARLQDGRGKLMVADLPTGTIRELLTVDLGPGVSIRDVAWGPSGRYVYYTERTEDQGTVLNRVPVTGGETEPVWLSQQMLTDLSISPAGDLVSFTIGENKGDYYVMENLRAALQSTEENR